MPLSSRAPIDSSYVSLDIGIVGLPNVGKSTLFNALTANSALSSNYPFATIEPNVGVVGLDDPRLPVLAEMYDSARVEPATVRFVDIAGLVRGASRGQGLGNQFLASIREVDAVCQVVRSFREPDVAHVDGDVDPGRDIETVDTELILADLQTIDKALPRLRKEVRSAKAGHEDAKERGAVLAAVERAREVLDGGQTLYRAASGGDVDLGRLGELHLLTVKPFLYLFNVDAKELSDESAQRELSRLAAPARALFLDAQIEADLQELPEEDARDLLHSTGQDEPGLSRLARAGFRTLGLQTFLTVGPKEARAWTIREGTTALEAAGIVHSDFRRGFIRAEIVSYDDLVVAGSFAAARTAGKLRSEGKNYVMREGDVVDFRFHV